MYELNDIQTPSNATGVALGIRTITPGSSRISSICNHAWFLNKPSDRRIDSKPFNLTSLSFHLIPPRHKIWPLTFLAAPVRHNKLTLCRLRVLHISLRSAPQLLSLTSQLQFDATTIHVSHQLISARHLANGQTRINLAPHQFTLLLSNTRNFTHRWSLRCSFSAHPEAPVEKCPP